MTPPDSTPDPDSTPIPDARLLAVVLDPDVIRLVSAETDELLAEFEDPGGVNIAYLRFSRDGARLVALQVDQRVLVWDLRRVREELQKRGLDWNVPPFPTEATGPKPLAKPLKIFLAESASL
jgi:hypothetical protein